MAILTRLTLVSLFVLIASCSTGEQARLAKPEMAPVTSYAQKGYIAFCYHDVRDDLYDDMDEDQVAVGTYNLIQHFSWLKEQGYTIIGIDDLEAAKKGKQPLPIKAAMLTFDDGYRSMYTKVFPLLKLFGYKALLAVTGNWIDKAQAGDKKITYGAQTVSGDRFLTWRQIKEMSDSGLVEIASHSYDLHKGIVANPQGNREPAATTLAYDPKKQKYETEAHMRKRVRDDLLASVASIKKAIGKTPRVMVWPYGEYNMIGVEEAQKRGMTYSLTLVEGMNNGERPTAIRRFIVGRNPNLADFVWLVRNAGKNSDPIRVVHVDLDYVYDADPAQQKRNLGLLLDRIKRLKINTVYLQAFADPDGDGAAEALYFPNRHLPMRADLFNRVAWQLQTRAHVAVYAWLPVFAFKMPDASYNKQLGVREIVDGKNILSRDPYWRLSPFAAATRKIVTEIYEDLGAHAAIAGLLFHDDAFLRDNEDAHPEAIARYVQWGLPANIDAIRTDQKTMQLWTSKKIDYLNQFTTNLANGVRKYRPRIKTARNIYALPLLNPKSIEWFSQSYGSFLSTYDSVAVMAMPYMEKVDNPEQFLTDLVAAAARYPDGLSRGIFELQSIDWRTSKKIPAETMVKQMALLEQLGMVNFGYYPDDFITGQPDLETIRSGMSLEQYPFPKK